MSGIICWACLTLAISVTQFALLQWRSDLNKNQEKNESQQNQDLWWISLRGCHRSSTSTSSNPGKTWYGYQDPWKSVVADDRSGQPDSADSQEVADSETFVMGNDAPEFVNKVKDQVRKRQKRMSNVADSGEEHSIIWGMFMAAMNAATFMGKNFMDNENSIKNSRDLTLKKMFDITAKLVGEQEEINNADKIQWKNHSWKYLSLIGDETVINLQHTKVYVFSDSVLCLGRVHQHPQSNEPWKERIGWIVTDKSYRDYSMESRPSSSGIFPRIHCVGALR